MPAMASESDDFSHMTTVFPLQIPGRSGRARWTSLASTPPIEVCGWTVCVGVGKCGVLALDTSCKFRLLSFAWRPRLRLLC